MGYTLEQFAAKCHDALKSQPGTEGRKAVCGLVQEVLKDGEFVARYIPEGTPERKVLYEDPELGFTILAHALCRGEGQQAARSRAVLGDLRPGRRRDDHDRLGLPGATDRDGSPARRSMCATTR